MPTGGAIVSWVERNGQRSEVRVRQVETNGTTGMAVNVSGTTGVQSGAFPRIERSGRGEEQRILEISFKSGQVWQLFDVPHGIYSEIHASTISSFLKFIARRYRAAPVKTGLKAIVVPENMNCPICKAPMKQSNRAENAFDNFIRVFWQCPSCKKSKWETYQGPHRMDVKQNERKVRWH